MNNSTVGIGTIYLQVSYIIDAIDRRQVRDKRSIKDDVEAEEEEEEEEG